MAYGSDCGSYGDRADSSATVSVTYLQAVAVPMPNPAASSANVSPLRRYGRTSRACCPGPSLRHGEPICAVAADDPGGVSEGLARQRQRGRVEKHPEPLGDRCGSWSIASSTSTAAALRAVRWAKGTRR